MEYKTVRISDKTHELLRKLAYRDRTKIIKVIEESVALYAKQ
jgi:hypothetical protein